MNVEELRNEYELLIEKEDRLLRQIQTGETCLFALLETMYRKEREMDQETAKELIQRIYSYTDEHRSELWQVRMEKNDTCDTAETREPIRRWGT
ncbi:hypothetical protein SAMN02799630_04555 [Paenibacillus sp. UNCCL117]|uniref:hypothetical protein n=1 Tax=unclassified Paenibacillus TaxID=185978 RepID=UPI000888D83D|nr:MULTISPECIES: hypothetical protein [unclassified Paenibacillus]SDD64495.1 hypothetical protein SAMN04488602_11185 [Paenibacillus sp. cl123]SFW58309.1 hypothetical protein SAMN02799630_04555 [Paenibacillus sp. UNCCL117]